MRELLVVAHGICNLQHATCNARMLIASCIDVGAAQEDELGGPAEEMRFPLPAAPSPGAQAALLAACREVARAGGASMPPAALALLTWELGDAVLRAFRCAAHCHVTDSLSACTPCT